MTIYPYFAKNILLPVSDFVLNTKIHQELKHLGKSQWWPHEKLQQYQNKKLHKLIKHSYENIPYYHNVFRKLKLYPDDIKNYEHLEKLPMLTKNIVRENFSTLRAKNFTKWNPISGATSGSTGKPLRYFVDSQSTSTGWASAFRGWSFAGYKFGDKRVTLAGASLIPHKKLTVKQQLRIKLERNLQLSAVHMSDEIMNKYIKKLNAYNPKFLRGYPSAWYSFAQYLEKSGYNLNFYPTAIFTTAEMLYPYQRKLIEDVFGCEIFDGYGCQDGGASAFECKEHFGYHISIERCVMEFIKDNINVSNEEEGNIVLTDLDNYAMPFIRYEVGDIGIPSDEKCPCGRGLPLMSSIIGRTTDVITFNNGITLSGPALTLIFGPLNIEQYQVIKKKDNMLLIKIIKGSDYSQNDEIHILKTIKAHVGNDIDISIEYVSEIPKTKAGKLKFIISS